MEQKNYLSNIQNLGPQVTNALNHYGVFGKDELDCDVAYTVTAAGGGITAKLCAIDVNTLEVKRSIPLPGATGAWSITVATDGSVYAGSFTNGHLYRYIPGENDIYDLGQPIEGESHIFALTAGEDGVVYGGTYSHCYVFKYKDGIVTTISPYGVGKPIDEHEQYVRSLAYDTLNHKLYIGIGAHAKLYSYDITSCELTQILPQSYKDNSFVYNLDVVLGKVFARLSPTAQMVVLTEQKENSNGATISIDCKIDDVISQGISPDFEGKIYYVNRSNRLCYYEISSRTYESLNIDVTFSPCAMSIVKLKDQHNYPGYSLVALGQLYGKVRLFKYNFATQKLSHDIVDIPEVPIEIQKIKKGPDGKIYSSGYICGNTGIYNPTDGSYVQYRGIGQCENMVVVAGKLYFGVYPHALIYEYDPGATWDIDKKGNNPRQLFSLCEYDQDRPFGMTGGEDKLFVGTVPGYGKLGGILAIYDTITRAEVKVIRNIVPQQSIISLAYKDGRVYGGTSISGGLGITPTQTEAKFFVYDVSTETKISEFTPVQGGKAITALTVGPDGRIWGMDEGHLFIYNPLNEKIEYCEQKFSDVDYSKVDHVWRDAFLEVGKDGHIYGSISDRLFKIDIVTKEITLILESNVTLLTQDNNGDLYYAYGEELSRIYL